MHDWFVSNIKDAPEQPKQPKKAARRPAQPYATAPYGFSRRETSESASSMSISIMTPSEASDLSEANFEGPDRNVSFSRQPDEEELTFSISLKSSNAASSYLICRRASFNPEWMRNQDSKLFHCCCTNCNELDYTRKFSINRFPC